MYQSGSLLEQNNAKERNQRMVCRSKTKITEWWSDLLAVIIVVSIQDMVWTEWEYYPLDIVQCIIEFNGRYL